MLSCQAPILCYNYGMWIFTWCTIYASFLVTGFIFPEDFIGTTALKYLGIFLNLVYAHHVSPKDYLLEIALLFTFLADTILVVDNSAILGVFVFAIAQFFHIARLAGLKPRAFIIFLALITIVLHVAHLANFNYMYVIGLFYASCLLTNLYLSTNWYLDTHSPAAFSAFVGFLLFALCDFCVAGSYLSRTGVLPAVLTPFANYLAWAFYYPSQIFIANSSKTKKVVLQ